MITTKHLTEDERKAIFEIKERVIGFTGNRLKGFYLYGSKARGDCHEESDADIAIVVAELDRGTKRAIIDIVVEVEVKYFVVISSLVLSEIDFKRLRDAERRIALNIEQEGIAL